MKPYQKGKGKPKQTEDVVKNRVFDATYQKDETYRPVLRGSDIEKYLIKWDGSSWIKFGDCLAEPRYSGNFDAPEKIVIRQTGDSLISTIDDRQFICMNNLHILHCTSQDYSLKYILGLINSSFMNYFYQCLNPEKGEALAEVKKNHVEQLLIPTAGEGDRAAIEKLVSYVLYLTEQLKDVPTIGKGLEQASADKVMTQYFEKIIDALVYELYLTEELHTKNKYFMRYLLAENLPDLEIIEGNKIVTLRQIFQKLFHKDYPIAKNLFFLDSVEEIRIIEGKK